jgi:hypothetical protein
MMPLVVVVGLDDRAHQTAHADPVRAHVHRHPLAVLVVTTSAHRLGILRAEVEDLPDLDPAPHAPARFGHASKAASSWVSSVRA